MNLHKRPLAAWTLSLLGACCGITTSASATNSADDRVAALEQRLNHSLQLIDELSARVRELEAQRDAAQRQAAGQGPAVAQTQQPPPAPAQQAQLQAQTQSRLENVEQELSQLADANAARGGGSTGVPLHGFADVGIGNHTANRPGLKGANVGALDIYLNPKLGEHTRSLFELTFEVNAQGNVEPDLERAQIGYQWSDAATLWIGRFHTPFGYYNTAFHHGQQIATALRRPRFLLFEDQGGVMPNHTVGAWLTGADRLSDGKLTYDVFVGNGQAIIDGAIDQRNGGVDHGGAIFGGNLGYVFDEVLPGLKVGISAFRSDIIDALPNGHLTRVDNAGVYFAYDTDSVEYLGEYYRFNDRDISVGGRAYTSDAGFVQLGWRLPVAMPYVRYEHAVLDQADQYFAFQESGSSYYRAALGLRFDLDVKSALKLELARTKNTDRLVQQWTDAMLDYAIRF